MKKIMKNLLLLMIVIMSCACVKDETIMTINSDNSVNLEINLGYSINSSKTIKIDELKDIVSPLGFSVDSYHDNQFNGYRISKKINNIKDISSKNNNIINLADIITGKFDETKLFKVKKGFFKNTYIANFYYDFRDIYNYNLKIYLFGESTDANSQDIENYIQKYISHVSNIELIKYNVISNIDNFNLLNNSLNKLGLTYQGIPIILIGDKIFYGNDNDVKNAIISEIESILNNNTNYVDIINNDFDSNYELIYKVNLPTKNLTNNASKTDNDGKTLIWNGNYFNENRIEFSFSIFKISSIILFVLALVFLIVLLILGIFLYKKTQQDRNKFIVKNTNIDHIIPKVDENNKITSINDLINK